MAKKTQFLDEAVEMALYQLAIGAKTKEYKKIIKNEEITEETETTKELAPDLKAIQLWLATRQPEVWGDAKENDMGKVEEILNMLNELCNDEKET
jgi:hypothetical protein